MHTCEESQVREDRHRVIRQGCHHKECLHYSAAQPLLSKILQAGVQIPTGDLRSAEPRGCGCGLHLTNE